MILFFSGTGNSQFVAQMVSEIINDKLLSLNELIKNDNYSEIYSDKPLVIVAPVYGWRLPKIVQEFILKTTFKGNNSTYFILTCGSESGDAVKYAKELCHKKDFKFMGLKTLLMPENYVAMFTVPNENEVEKIVSKSVPQIKAVAEDILHLKKLNDEKVSFADKIKSGPINSLFYKIIVSAKGFRVEDNCVGCNKCVEVCPLNNIKLVNSKPQWGSSCTHCMACICGCPVEAIEYKNRTVGKRRYYFKELHKI